MSCSRRAAGLPAGPLDARPLPAAARCSGMAGDLRPCHSCAAPRSRHAPALRVLLYSPWRGPYCAFRQLQTGGAPPPAARVCLLGAWQGARAARRRADTCARARARAGAGLLPLAGHHAPRRKTAQRAPAAPPPPARGSQRRASIRGAGRTRQEAHGLTHACRRQGCAPAVQPCHQKWTS